MRSPGGRGCSQLVKLFRIEAGQCLAQRTRRPRRFGTLRPYSSSRNGSARSSREVSNRSNCDRSSVLVKTPLRQPPSNSASAQRVAIGSRNWLGDEAVLRTRGISDRSKSVPPSRAAGATGEGDTQIGGERDQSCYASSFIQVRQSRKYFRPGWRSGCGPPIGGFPQKPPRKPPLPGSATAPH